MKNDLLKTFGLFLLFTILITSCKKSISEPEGKTDILTGAWQEVGLSGGFSRLVIFEPGGGFTLKASDKVGLSVTLKGKYSIENNNLKVNVTEETTRQDNGTMLKKAVNVELYERGKFSIANTVLTINCITYPADAPVDTEFKYNKIIAID